MTENQLRRIIREEITYGDTADTGAGLNLNESFKKLLSGWSTRAFPPGDPSQTGWTDSFVKNMMAIFRTPGADGYFKILEHLFSYRLIPGNQYLFSQNLQAFLARAALFRLRDMQSNGVTGKPEETLPGILREVDESMVKDPAGVEATSLARELGVTISPVNLLRFTFSSGFPEQYSRVWNQARP